MIFSSIIFLCYFLPIFLLLYSFSKLSYRNYVLLGASLLFYSWGAPEFIFLILAATVVDFYLVRTLYRSKKLDHKKKLLCFSIVLNLSLLLYFKYSNFFVENVNELFNQFHIKNIEWVAVALPIGISFYTFQSITYSVDVYRKNTAPLKKLSDYLLYIFCFPQLIAGPIVRFSTISKEITHRAENLDLKLSGFYRFCIGLSKKVLIANVMGKQADFILDGSLSHLQCGDAWLGLAAYTFQIYFDFAGYSDMAIGLGKMMGFHFPENFESPYTARSISGFWKKWHITLGTFMKDYLYIPMGGSRVSSQRLFFNLLVVFLLSGIWHGAAWNFLIWGAYHGIFILMDRLFLKKLLERTGKWFSMLATFFVVMMGWLIFRIEDLWRFNIYFQKLFQFSDFKIPHAFEGFYPTVLVAILFSFVAGFKIGKQLDLFFFHKEKYNSAQHLYLSLMTVIMLILCISSIATTGFNPFIYFRF